ncbi:MAG TPA: sulfatase [Candidatus Binatia bacterium]|nr:sulfatase [Candidatus Binatia bacterium]
MEGRVGVLAGRLARGAGAGLAAGVVWWLVECAANWALGGTLSSEAAGTILGLDLLFGGAAGAVVGLLGVRSANGLALGLTAAYGFLRVYEPPGLRSELLFLALAPLGVLVGVRLAGGGRRGALPFVQLTLVTVAATVFGKAGITEVQSYFAQTEPSALTLVLLLVGLPLAGVVVDRLLGFVIRRDGVRLGLEVVAAAVALVVWGAPLSTAALDTPPLPVPAARGAPDVLLISLDTTRADHMSTYGYARETSPHLTTLARDGLNFTQARSPAEWTVPGHASMLTGMYPSRHGAHYAGTWQSGPQIYGRRRVFPLADDRVTLAEVLRERGYRTGGFVANFANLYRGFGMAQGFDHYDDAPGVMLKPVPHAVRFVQRFDPTFMKRPFRSAHEIAATALEWMDAGPRDRPAFVFLNLLEPHHWMLPPPPFDRWARELPQTPRLAGRGFFTHKIPTRLTPEEQAFVVATYDGQIALMDEALGELWAALKARGRYENTVIVVTADHGELLGEHEQVGHGGRMMYEGLLHIPMVVKLPGADRARGEQHGPVQLVDVLPTILAAVGAPVPPGVQGEKMPHVDHEIVAEEHINPEFVSHYGEVYDRAIRVLYDRPWKLIETSKGERMLFDLGRDPGEAENLVTREPERVTELERRLDAAMSVMLTDAGRQPHVN